MKKISLFAVMTITGMTYTVCNNEWGDELYTQIVSFKIPRGSNGMYNICMRYRVDGAGQYKLPIIVSGSTLNTSDADVKIGIDNDALDILNKTRSTVGRNDLWFKQLSGRSYSSPSPTCHVPSGKVVANYIIDFNFSGLDLNEQRVFPLTIEPNSLYMQNIRKGWYKALLNIDLFNNYSGRYSATNMNIYIDGTINDPAVKDNRLTRVVDGHSIFFYARAVWEEDVNRHRYKMIATFGDGTSDAEGNTTDPMIITTDDPANGVAIEQSGNYTCSYRVSKYPTGPCLERRVMTLYLDYKYSGITSDPSNPIRLHCKRNVTMERQYSILILDEEQAIFW